MTARFLQGIEEVDKDMGTRAAVFHKNVDEVLGKNKEQLREIKSAILPILKEQEKTVADGLQKVKKEAKIFEDQLRDGDLESILQYDESQDSQPEIPPKLSYLSPPVLTSGQIDTQLLAEMYGNVTLYPPPPVADAKNRIRTESLSVNIGFPLDVERSMMVLPSIKSKFQVRYEAPTIVCAGSDQAWLKADERVLYLFDSQGNLKDSIHTDFNFRGVCASNNGDILLSDCSNKCIRSVSSDKKVKTLFKTRWEPWGVCCLNSGKVAVTFTDQGKVVIYDASGHTSKELDRYFFRLPGKITQNKVNKQLYITDQDGESSDYPGKVVVLREDRSFENYTFLFQYKGPDNMEFLPSDLCADKVGNVFITDFFNDRVLILNEKNQFQQYLVTASQDVNTPSSIDVDNDGNVWVGQDDGIITVVNYM